MAVLLSTKLKIIYSITSRLCTADDPLDVIFDKLFQYFVLSSTYLSDHYNSFVRITI